MDDYLWELANEAIDDYKQEQEDEQPKQIQYQDYELNNNKYDKCHECKHLNICEQSCMDCGVVISVNISHAAEWNNYKDDTGNYAVNTQRGDTYVDDNPYSKSGTLLNLPNNNSFIAKLQIQQTFSHKQKTYWETTTKLMNVGKLFNISNDNIMTAKNLWYKYMESGKLTRASVRKGLIAACLYHSCIINKTPIERDEILTAFECSTKTLSKGEKVLFQVLDGYEYMRQFVHNGVQVEDSNAFNKYCSMLELPYKVGMLCNNLYDKYKIQLQAVTPKSAVGGIITYIVKYDLKLKSPTKSAISAIVDVCTPTINKVISIIQTENLKLSNNK